jgi:hypothetical protein
VHRSVAFALLLQQRGFLDACKGSLPPVVIPVFRDLAGSDRAAAAAEAMPRSRLISAPLVCKVPLRSFAGVGVVLSVLLLLLLLLLPLLLLLLPPPPLVI